MPLNLFLSSGFLQSFMVHINFTINGSSSKKKIHVYGDKHCIKSVDFLGLWLF